MDKELRDQLASTTLAVRRMLEDEFARQLEGVFDIFPDGRINDRPSDTLTPEQRFTRAKIVASIERRRAKGEPQAESVYAYMRESAFTFLNRLAAFKMMEARGLVQECVSRGPESSGFKEFSGLAPGLTTLPDKGYQLYLESLCDEIGREVGALFTRSDSSSLLWPSRRVLEGVLATINEESLASVWAGDETIGWIYQYYNDPTERKKMREESAAPRNSRELAVRNQFFTPRYVVEFLTDNTLGRIWYEMTQGDTKLKEQCLYLVRRPTEIFLKPGETAPEQPKQDNLSQEDLLKQPVFIPHRPLKDPRTILMLDPACGSMHFGLYAFDLFEVIYDETWALEEKLGADALSRAPGMESLHSTYAGKDAFLKDVPRLIIEHNLHGIDIDPRCAQIAGLSLWLRAQKAWQRLGLKPAERPAIKRSNIVCAEPMPGEKELLREFVEREFPAQERGFCLRLLEAIFDKMQLAGEAGSLLKIEEEIRSAIEDARDAWQKLATKPQELFTTTELNQISTAPELTGLEQAVSSLTAGPRHLTTDFWERIEERIYAALRDYAEQAENGGGFQRRLFAEDAARGIAFIDVCRKRYDVVEMNPPFGDSSRQVKTYLTENYPNTKSDLYAAFVERGLAILGAGALGAITSRSGFFQSSFHKWRTQVLLATAPPFAVADLGGGVLDGAMVETAAYCLLKGQRRGSLFVRLGRDAQKAEALLSTVTKLAQGGSSDNAFHVKSERFKTIPGTPFTYWVTEGIRKMFVDLPAYEAKDRTVKQGLATADDFRFVRASWEVNPTSIARVESDAEPTRYWFPYPKGGEFSPFYADIPLIVDWKHSGSQYWHNLSATGGVRSNIWMLNESVRQYFFQPGLTYPRRLHRLAVMPMPIGSIISVRGSGIYGSRSDLLSIAGLFSSAPFDFLVKCMLGRFGHPQFDNGTLCKTPVPRGFPAVARELEIPTTRAISLKRQRDTSNEVSHIFCAPPACLTSAIGLADELAKWLRSGEETDAAISKIQLSIDEIAYRLYGFSKDDRQAVADSTQFAEGDTSDEDSDDENSTDLDRVDISTLVSGIASYWLGVAFGRWDIRYATGEQTAPELPDPFAPLPVCPPGQLQNAQGLPTRSEDVPAAYPVRIPWDGILVDDPNHPLDIERRVREVIEIIWKDRAEAIEYEACEILGVKSLRDYFRKPAGFFVDHLKRYSKSRRQAPIYWPLSSPAGLYSVWLYYHRLTADTFFTLLREIVKPRLEDEERHLFNLKQSAGPSPTPSQAREISASSELTEDLRAFHDEVQRIASLWKPNLNDGVLINHAPLWRLAPHAAWRKSLKETWDALCAGEYDWSHLAFHLWPERVIPKCATDRSLAIAHELEAFFWEEDSKSGKWIARKRTQVDVDQLLTRHTSPAVKASLESLLTAPALGGGAAKKGRKAKAA